MNYKSTVSVLTKAGYSISNKCRYEGETYHDFNKFRNDTSISLVIDEMSGSVSRIEITTRKWNDKMRRYEPVKETITGLQQLMDKFAPRKPITL